ncbi:MAG TPA: zf-HC2 domain-containing protein, partial [Myxococcota bacterium]|nr:zf-HC2 domain-containing protein [Myxococcota bacterium]
MSELLRRDGHLLDLAIDRYLAGELRPDQVAELEAHAGACAPCAAQVAEARQDVALPPVAWPERQAEVV